MLAQHGLLTFLILKASGKGIRKLSFRRCRTIIITYIFTWKNEEFPDVIPHLRADIAPFLSEKGIRLIGVDVPSVDPLDDKELAAHHQLFKHGIHILENVVLDHVADGDYELIALPLALTDADGSPVRAVIRPI